MDLSKYNKTLLYIDSSDRETNTEINDFVVNLNLPVGIIEYIEVHSAEIPNVIYPIRSNFNSKFSFIDTGATERVIVLDDGNYHIDNLLSTIKTKMNVYAGTYDLSYNEINYKITITETGNNNFQLLTSDKDLTLWSVLGFTTTSNLTGAYTYTASSVFNLSHEPNYCFINSTLIHSSKDKIFSSNKNKKAYSMCLLKCPIYTQFGEIIHHRPSTKIIFEVEERNLNQIRFWIQDHNSNHLPLDRDWSIGLILYSK